MLVISHIAGRTRVAAVTSTLAALLMVAAGPARAQERWEWPERAQNLKQLPEDFPPERLRAVMTGFTRALGVRCSHCHVGQEGQPLTAYDFASDDNPKKNVARAMLDMLGDINDHLKAIDTGRAERVNMWCHTCHDGRPRPITLQEDLEETLAASGLEATLTRYDRLRAEHYGDSTYDFTEPTLNALGYALLGRGEHDAAIAVFRLNAKHHPESTNAWDSLAEAYLESSRREHAIVFYRKALEVDPTNANAADQLRKLATATP